MELSKINMTTEEILTDLVRICYRLIVRFSSDDATTEEQALIPVMINSIISIICNL